MAGRTNLDSATKTELDTYGAKYPAFFLRLDVINDPIFAWTGIGPARLTGTGDIALEGLTFDGVANAGQVTDVVDAVGGSQSLTVALSGVDLNSTDLRQALESRTAWQFQPAWLWLVMFTYAGAMIGKPIRLKSGRIDQINPSMSETGEGIVSVVIESQQAYASQALGTRWSEQRDQVDSTDSSQDYIWSLANMTPEIGVANDRATAAGEAAVINQIFYGGGGTKMNPGLLI